MLKRMILKEPETVEFPDHIQVKRSARARRMALRFDPKDRAFHLILPRGTSLTRAYRFAEEHDDWMLDNLRKLPEAIPYEDGTVLPIFGRNRRIEIIYDPSRKTTEIELKLTKLQVLTNQKDPSSRIERFLKRLVLGELEKLSREKARRIREPLQNVSVRDTKSRWGSCNSEGNISYSWRLVFAPHEALDYVVAHEVAHLRHLDHSAKFWALCRKLSEDFLEGQFWMQNHGHELMRFGAER